MVDFSKRFTCARCHKTRLYTGDGPPRDAICRECGEQERAWRRSRERSHKGCYGCGGRCNCGMDDGGIDYDGDASIGTGTHRVSDCPVHPRDNLDRSVQMAEPQHGRRKVLREGAPVDTTSSDFDVRDGDLLVVSYPEVKVPGPAGSYMMITVGGLIYTRQLLAGDNVGQQYDRIYAFLKGRAERDANEKVAAYVQQLAQARQQQPNRS